MVGLSFDALDPDLSFGAWCHVDLRQDMVPRADLLAALSDSRSCQDHAARTEIQLDKVREQLTRAQSETSEMREAMQVV